MGNGHVSANSGGMELSVTEVGGIYWTLFAGKNEIYV